MLLDLHARGRGCRTQLNINFSTELRRVVFTCRKIKSWGLEWGPYMKYRTGEIDITYTILARQTRGNTSEGLGIDIIKIDLEETKCEIVEWIHLARDRE